MLVQIDKEKLIQLYVKEDLRVSDIAKILHHGNETIVRNLKEAGISIKGIKHYLVKPEIIFTKEQYEFFDGLIISDGSLCQGIEIHRNRNAYINCKFKYKEFANYINNYLNFGCNVRKYRHISDRYKNGFCDNYILYSKNNTLYTREKMRWYPDGIKIIPNDFRFSPISMNIMYLGDGCLHNNQNIYLSTQAFCKEDLEKTIVVWLFGVGIKSRVCKDNQIFINSENSIKFLNYIGPCPVDCYKYKWDIKQKIQRS